LYDSDLRLKFDAVQLQVKRHANTFFTFGPMLGHPLLH